MSKSKEEIASEKIAERLKQVYRILDECKVIADEAQTDFRFDPAYGMGGTYEHGEWRPSSMSC